MQGLPGNCLRNQTVGSVFYFPVVRGLRMCFVFVLCRFMAIKLPLDAAQRVCTRANQGQFGLIQFVLIEFQLRLSQIDLLLQIVATIRFSCRKLFFELIEAVLISFYGCLSFVDSGKEFARFWFWRDGVLGGITKCVSEREVYFVVGQPEGLLRESLLVRIGGQSSHGSGTLQGALINQRWASATSLGCDA